jgi:type VI secretion system secreted protein VgrG
MYFVPEVGEEVLVAFENRNPEKPYMQGAMYNGNEVPGFHTPSNDIKTIQTRSGHIIKFTEDESIIITDKSGNIIHLDTVGSNINITAPETITITCKNMNINVAENMNTTVGANKSDAVGINSSESVGVNKSETVGAVKNSFVGGDSMMNVMGKLTETITGDKVSSVEKDKQTIINGNSTSSVQENHEIHSKSEIHNNAAEKSKMF